MEKLRGHYVPLKNQLGATVVIVALMLTVLVGFVALAIDIGYLMVTKNELQNVVDGAALAGARQLGANYKDMTYAEQQNYVCDPATIIAVAQDVGLKNKAASKWITINDADVEIGHWSAGSFSETLNKPDAVKVTARREDSSADGPITTFFAGVLGIDFMEASASSTAALTGKSTTVPGELKLPVGISREWFDRNPGETCGDQIKFSPTNDPDACAGWTTFTAQANTPSLRSILDGDLASDPTIAGVTDFNYTGGDVAAVFSNLLLLFKRKGYDVDINGDWIYNVSSGDIVKFATVAQGAVPLYELDNAGNPTAFHAYYPVDDNDPDYQDPAQRPRNNHAWETTVVVYANDDGTADCDNPNQTRSVVGYARIRLTDVVEAPDNLVVGELICDFVDPEPTRGGGGESFGTIGPIPGLVQ
jgi:Flp pilus assembly protein TadG